jgi:hypothetical protein
MTAEQRSERHLTTILEDLYLGPAPTYRDQVMATAVRRRQRSSWTFPGRWLPMAEFASRPVFAPRVPWRTIGVAFVIIALLTVAAVIYVGAQQNKVPPPFGVARNGSIAWAIDGDIYVGDPTAGTSRAIVVGDDIDRNPIFSRDGSKLAFFRQAPNETGLFDLALTGRDGGAVTIVTQAPIRMPRASEWSPDGAAIVVNDDEGRVVRFDTSGKTAPLVIALGADLRTGAFRPPDGAQVLIQRGTEWGTGLYLINADGIGTTTTLIETGPARNSGRPDGGTWSPDGRFIAFRMITLGAPVDDARMYVMNADGTDILQLDKDPGYWVDDDVVWSPDSSHIAFNRWHWNEVQALHNIRPIGIVAIAGGKIGQVGLAPADDGALFDFAPDGKTILSMPGTLAAAFTWSANAVGTVARPDLIDVQTGDTRPLDWSVGSAASWQRLAP